MEPVINPFPRIIDLPSGLQVAQTRPLKGRDAVAAHRVANEATDLEKGAALVAQVVTANGRPMVMEDLLDLDLEDLMLLLETVPGKLKGSTPTS